MSRQKRLRGEPAPGGAAAIDGDDGEMPPLEPIYGAVAGGGIGGDQAVDNREIEIQLGDIEAVSEREIAARQRIAEANRGRERQGALQAELGQLRGQREAILHEVRCLLPSNPGIRAAADLEQRRAIAPLVDIFFDAFRPFLTEAYDDDATFRECFGIRRDAALTEENNLLRNGFELLLKESIVQGINRPQAAITALTQLLFDNNPARMLVSAGGSIVAIILARDALRIFSSTVISVMTFGTLSLQQLTNLCCFVYYNCTLVNLRNLLIYFNVPVDNAQAFIQAIQHFNREQRQYIIMSLFLFGLNAIRDPRIVEEQVRAAIDRLIEGAQRYFPRNGGAQGDPAAGDNNAAGLAPPPADQAAAAAAAAAALNQAQAGIAPAAAAAPAQGQQNRSLLQIFGDQGIIAFINNILRNGWMRGLRITTSCLREVFRIYLSRPHAGQGLSFNLVDFTGRMARWGVAAIQERSAVLDPAKPNQEVIRLLAAVNGLDVTTPARCESALYEFGRNLKGIRVGPNNDQTAGAVRILQNEGDDRTLVYLTPDAAPGCLDALRGYFRPDQTVNVERLQNACLGMRLFVFEQGMRSNILAAAVGRRVNAGQEDPEQNFDDTQNAVQASQSVQRMEEFLLEDNDTVTKNLFGRVRLMLQAFGNFQAEQLQHLGVVIQQILPDEEPGVSPAQILARERHAARMPHKEHVKTAVRASIIANRELLEEQKQFIIEHLMEFIDDMNFDVIQQYVVRANPGDAIPQRFLESCQNFVNLPRQIDALQENAAFAAAATTAIYSGLGRCAASLMNAAVVSSGAVAGVARAGIGQVSGLFQSVFGRRAAAAAAVVVANVEQGAPPQEAAQDAAAVPGAAIIANIELAQQQEPQARVEEEQAHSIPNDGGGRSRSRKRSASRGTRRKGKQSSKKLKRKSRRYQRRASSRKGRK